MQEIEITLEQLLESRDKRAEFQTILLRGYGTPLVSFTVNMPGKVKKNHRSARVFDVGVEAIRDHEMALMNRFYEGVKAIEGVTIYGDFESERTAVVTLNIRDFDSSAVSDELAEYYDIATRPGAHCAPRMHMALGTEEQGAVRFSFAWFNTMEDVDAAIAAVKEMAEE